MKLLDRRAGGALSIVALLLASCSGTLPGVQAPPERPPPRRFVIRTAPEGAGGAPAAAVPAAAAEGGSAETAPQAQGLPSPSQAHSAPPAAGPPPAASDVRERQFEILTEAVTALRQEVARSYAHSQEVTQENQRLRALVTALRGELAKSRNQNKAVQNQLRTVEKRLKETRIPPPETGKAAAGREAVESGKAAGGGAEPEAKAPEPSSDAADAREP